MSKINALRKKQGMSIDEFAKALGISKSLCIKLIYEDRTPTVNVLKRIKAAFPAESVEDYLYG